LFGFLLANARPVVAFLARLFEASFDDWRTGWGTVFPFLNIFSPPISKDSVQENGRGGHHIPDRISGVNAFWTRV
jgi:hypothetical protein